MPSAAQGGGGGSDYRSHDMENPYGGGRGFHEVDHGDGRYDTALAQQSAGIHVEPGLMDTPQFGGSDLGLTAPTASNPNPDATNPDNLSQGPVLPAPEMHGTSALPTATSGLFSTGLAQSATFGFGGASQSNQASNTADESTGSGDDGGGL